jgi:hypothetical protein
MKTYKILFLILAISIFSSGCKKNNNKPFLPSVKGNANSVVVVISGSNWESEPGDKIKEKFGQFMPGLPQEEPIFDVLFTPHSSFDHIYQKQRNILITLIGPDYKDKVLVHKDRWAKGQIVITIMAPNKPAFVKLFESKSEEIIQIISDAEKTRLMANYRSGSDKTVHDQLQKKHKILLDVPKGYTIDRDTDNFIWLNNEYRDITEGVFIYYYTYTDSNTFTREFLLEKRNEMLKKYVSGEVEGSYMTTEERYPVEMKSFNLKSNIYTTELRGLWMMKGGVAMGGPFVSITQYDEKNKRIITVEGFVFAPGHEKRNIIRQVEAIIYSLNF